MSIEQTACEDLKAFERRLTEVIACLGPSTTRWRLVLAFISICTAVGAFYWLTDPDTSNCSFCQSLWNHPFFALSSCVLTALLFLLGIHKRVIAPSIITSRARLVLNDFNMSCDDSGKLILKPRPLSWVLQIQESCFMYRKRPYKARRSYCGRKKWAFNIKERVATGMARSYLCTNEQVTIPEE